MKNRMKLFKIALVLVTVTTIACRKEETAVNTENGELPQTMSSCRWEPQNPMPTRKAKQLTVVDIETGQTEVYYDCSEAGYSCDIGEKHKEGQGTRLSLVATDKQNFIDRNTDKSPSGILKHLKTNKDLSMYLFPKVFEKNVFQKLNTGAYSLISRSTYLAIIESKDKTPVYVYLFENGNDYYRAYLPDSNDCRLAKINTETGGIECIESGKNCRIRAGLNKVGHGQYLQMIEKELNNKTLPRLIEDGTYKIYESDDRVEIRPNSGIGETFYILK
jgi:hypothetical protein